MLEFSDVMRISEILALKIKGISFEKELRLYRVTKYGSTFGYFFVSRVTKIVQMSPEIILCQ